MSCGDNAPTQPEFVAKTDNATFTAHYSLDNPLLLLLHHGNQPWLHSGTKSTARMPGSPATNA